MNKQAAWVPSRFFVALNRWRWIKQSWIDDVEAAVVADKALSDSTLRYAGAGGPLGRASPNSDRLKHPVPNFR